MPTWNVFGLQHMIRIGRNKEKKKLVLFVLELFIV